MQNLIKGMEASQTNNRSFEDLIEKRQRHLYSVIRKRIQEQRVENQHITALFSTKHPDQMNNAGSVMHLLKSKNWQQRLMNPRQGKLKVNKSHIEQISKKHSNVTYSIITSSCVEGQQLLKKQQIFDQIEQSFKTKEKRHSFIYCGPCNEKGTLIVQTLNKPHGEQIQLQQIFDRFMGLEETKNVESIKFYLSCSYAGSAALRLKQKRQKLQSQYVRQRKVQIYCQTGSKDQNSDVSSFGDLLLRRYWQEKAPYALIQEYQIHLSEEFEKLNPCVMSLNQEEDQSNGIFSWTELEPIHWKKSKKKKM